MEHQDTLNATPWHFCWDERVFPPGTDSFLLSAFPRLSSGARICDLGAGAGLLGLLLLRREPTLHITGIELDGGAVALAQQNIVQNHLEAQLEILQGDLRKPEELPRSCGFDLIVCNPPYFPTGAGAAAAGAARQNARAEETCTVDDLCAAGVRLLRWGGKICLVHRPERLCDLMTALRKYGLEPKRLRLVQKNEHAAPSLLLLEGCRGGKPGLSMEAPLLLEQPDGTPSPELDAIYYREKEITP